MHEEIIEKLKKLLTQEDGDKSPNPNIAQVSIMIEHRKIELAEFVIEGKLKKRAMLTLINWARIMELNYYNAVLKLLGQNQKLDEIVKEVKEAFDSAHEAMEKLLVDIDS